ncbi:DNA repair protein RAD5 [Coprinopsis marcescibilis]|uniref:DNA repair protein RAD5 n=1 Tax=Coprinopsis marcescibilis TaxID=230819 RepID=A0A5C3L1V7_COPMA|nr:DNA repair protein RAD5 [Coprinopsis marcescibilis]
MDTGDVLDGPPPGSFFASSDEEGEPETSMVVDESDGLSAGSPLPSTPGPQPSSRDSSPAPAEEEKLFLDGDDEDDDEMQMDLIQEESLVPPAPSPGVSAGAGSDEEIQLINGFPSPRAGNSRSRDQSLRAPVQSTSRSSLPPTRKRKGSDLTPPTIVRTDTSQGDFPPTYLGEIIVTNAWSNVSGKYIKIGELFQVKRDDDDDVSESKASSSKPSGSSKSSTSSGKKKGDGKKQMSLTAMLKPQVPRNFKKKNADTIVRLLNMKGSEFGRLPTDCSWWIHKLLQLKLVEIRGIMTECPERLTTGVTMIVTLQFFILKPAFTKPSTSLNLNDAPGAMFNEGQETHEETDLRERKSAIVRLFEVLGLKPQAGAKMKGKNKANENITHEALKKMAQRPAKKIKEVVGDGEEIEVDDAEELSKNDIDAIYKKAQHNDKTMGMMEPAESFNMSLRPYQKQALLWMHSLEMGNMDAREATSMHPLWSQYAFPHDPTNDGDVIDLTMDEKVFYFNPYSGELSLEFPKTERKCRGGILADEMGMGKTIMLSALIQTSLPSENDVKGEDTNRRNPKQLKLNSAFKSVSRKASPKPPSATLIVAPTSLLSQWAEELQRSSKPGALKVMVWHGQNRLDLDGLVDEEEDGDNVIRVIVTSYGVLASEHAKSEKYKSPIFEIEWLRVVLDEAHACKSRSSKTAKAVYALSACRKWAVTGTPIINRLEDLYSLLKFLDFKPWSDFAFFRSFITLPFLAKDPKAIEIVQVILESILLRREKNMRDADGNKIVELPPKEETFEMLEFSPLERKIYDSIYHTVKLKFEQLEAKNLVGKNYTHILAMLMRLRRAVLHPRLVISQEDQPSSSLAGGDSKVELNDLLSRFADDSGGSSSNNNFAETFLANIAKEEVVECPVCFGEVEFPMFIPGCMHQFCKECITSHVGICEEKDQVPTCPTCGQGPIKSQELVEIVRKPKKEDDQPPSSQASEPDVVLRRNDFQSSTKLDALIQNLRRLRDQDPCFRAVVFSQFTTFLDLIEVVLTREKFDYYRFDGTMDVKKKSAAISEFKSASRKPKILIVSLKAGGVGLNLTTANHVFMMDCWWNAATENQAIDRVHRIGQEKTVYVKHFIVSCTIEGRILEIQKRKTAIVNEAFRGTQKSSGEPESLQNLKIMFGDE